MQTQRIKVGDIVKSSINNLYLYKVVAKRGRWVDVVTVPSGVLFHQDKFIKQPVGLFQKV